MNLKTQVSLKDIKKRKGFIIIDRDFIEDSRLDVVKELFANFYPYSVGPDFSLNKRRLIAYGYSEHFSELTDGSIVPEYVATVYIQEEFCKISFQKII